MTAADPFAEVRSDLVLVEQHLTALGVIVAECLAVLAEASKPARPPKSKRPQNSRQDGRRGA